MNVITDKNRLYKAKTTTNHTFIFTIDIYVLLTYPTKLYQQTTLIYGILNANSHTPTLTHTSTWLHPITLNKPIYIYPKEKGKATRTQQEMLYFT